MADRTETQFPNSSDAGDLRQFGYKQALRRTMGTYSSFAIAFSMVSITTAIFFMIPQLFNTAGGIGVWLWIPCAIGIFLIVLVYAHLGARIPLTGFAYQWNSRLVSPHYGWFTGWTGFLTFGAGTASVATAISTVFSADIWPNPTHRDEVVLAVSTVIVAAVINIIGIRLVSLLNNASVGFEIAGSVGAALLLFVGSLFFFHHHEGFAILTQAGPVNGHRAMWYSLALAAVVPLLTFVGWEGAADLAEETNDPRAATPRAMIRTSYISVIASFFVLIGFLIAMPESPAKTMGRSGNALIYIFGSHFGSAGTATLQIVVFVSMFSSLLANMTVATRMTYALARDNMLPGSAVIGRVNPRTRTPIVAILVITAIAAGINLLSAGIASNVVSITAISYYMMYGLTVGAAVWALIKRRIPAGDPNYFSLGRYAWPVAVVALLWSLTVVLDIALPQAGHVAVEYTAIAELAGVVWYALYLRSRIQIGRAGIQRHQAPHAGPERPNPESSSAAGIA